MLELAAEFLQVEFLCTVESVSHCHLIIILQMFIYLYDIILIREGVRDPFVEGRFVQ